MKIYKEFEQKSEEWHKWRNGCITSTDAKTLIGTKALLKSELIEKAEALGITDAKKMKVDELQKALIEKNEEVEKFIVKDNDTLYYKLLAYQLSDGTAPVDERAMDRGNRLEPEIRNLFNETYKKNFQEYGGLAREDYPEIAVSPDGMSEDMKEALEIKALAGWKHVKMWLENKILDEHIPQIIQYFVVNDDLEKLYFVSGVPEITIKPLVVFEVKREDYQKEIEISLKAQKAMIDKVRAKLLELNF